MHAKPGESGPFTGTLMTHATREGMLAFAANLISYHCCLRLDDVLGQLLGRMLRVQTILCSLGPHYFLHHLLCQRHCLLFYCLLTMVQLQPCERIETAIKVRVLSAQSCFNINTI